MTPDRCIDCHAAYPDGAPAWTETPHGHRLCMACRNGLQSPCMGNDGRPFIQLAPDMAFGEPCVGHSRLSAAMVASRVRGDGVQDTAENYRVSVAEVECAVWFVTTFSVGRRTVKP